MTRRHRVGLVLLVMAAAAGLLASREEMSRREAAVRYAAALHASGEARLRQRAEQEELTDRALTAAQTPDLVAAIGPHLLDGPTLAEQLRGQDWWRGVRATFSLTRIVLGTELWAAVGSPDPGTLDRAVVSLARKQQVASVVAQIGGRPCYLIAARLPVTTDGQPVLVLGKRVDPVLWAASSPPAPLPERAPADPVFLFLEAAGLFGLTGLVLVGGGRPERVVTEPVPPEKTTRDVGHVWADFDVPAPVARPARGSLDDDRRHRHDRRTPSTTEVTLEAVIDTGGDTGREARVLASTERGGPPGRASAPPRPIPSLVAPPSPALSAPPGAARSGAALALAPSAQPPPATPAASATPVPAGPPRHPSVPGGVPIPGHGQPGSAFGRYQLLDRLGEGGMAEIFTAVAHGVEGFSRVFVLKRLRPELARDKEAIGQFIDEARMQASLVHSNIVPVFDFGRVAEEYFMTQEYIVGRDLIRIIARNYEHGQRTLDPRFAYYVTHETLEALEYAHSKKDRQGQALGIVHRDVSAGNILVSARGEVKLSDFGIVKSNRRVTRTQVGMVKGNANFMSPEQARGQEVDARSDLFSIALVLYYCLTNQLLYDGDNDLEVLYKAASGPTAEDLQAIRRLPAPARDVLARALAVDPNARYQTATEFAAALAPFINGAKNEAARLMQVLFGEELGEEAA
jgi:hypothetical protein